jgi:hypothetical protein
MRLAESLEAGVTRINHPAGLPCHIRFQFCRDETGVSGRQFSVLEFNNTCLASTNDLIII